MKTEERKASIAVLLFQFMPIVLAIAGVMMNFNSIDFVYLLLVSIIFVRYFIATRK